MNPEACFECGEPAEHQHHVVPEVYGGTKTVPLCRQCHGKIHERGFAHRDLVKAGLAAAKAAGKRVGRPPGVAAPIKVTSSHEAQVISLKREGVKIAEIARRVGLSRPTVYKILDAA